MLRHVFNSLVAIILLICVLSVNACGPSTSSVTGTYELDKEAVRKAMQAEIDKQKASGEEDPMGGFGAAMAMGLVESMTVTMTLNADGTAQMNMSMMGDSQAMDGTWTLSGANITVTAGPEGEEKKPATGTVSGDTITLKAAEGEEEMPFDMVFKKKA
jgi:uncharacterized lipoprotein NlpE involved in copper resistance